MAGLTAGHYAGSNVTRRDRYERMRTALWSERSSFDAQWRELSEWVMPRRTRFSASDRNRGDRRGVNIIDSTARFAARTLQSGLHAGLTSPARPWFKLTTPDPELAEHKPVQEWLHQVTQRMAVVFSDSNLYQVLPTLYGDIGVFGTSAIAVLEDTIDLFRCYAYPLGSFALGLSSRNIVNSFVRDYQLSVRQVVEEFGVRRGFREIDWSGISLTVKHLWDQGNYEAPVELTWIVQPNEQADRRKLGGEFLPFASCHFERGENQGVFLRESGFETFPILAPRWDVTGEDTYGTDCPGMVTLGDVKGLQIMQKAKGKAIHKMVDPPLVGHAELRATKTSLLPGDITYMANASQHALRAIHEVGLNLEHLSRDMAEHQFRIQRGFFEDLFLMLATSDRTLGADRPTAREISERHEEKLLALGPVLERTNDELLDPLIDRVYHLMDASGLVPPAPPELEGVALKVEYQSILAQAQQLVGVVQLDRFVGSILPFAESFPEIRNKVVINSVIDGYALMLGVDPSLVRSNEEADQLAQQQAAAQQATASAERAQMIGKAAKDAAAAPMGQGTALDALVGQGATVQ